MGNGIFIVVDGIDGAGKTTQVNLLSEALQNIGVGIIQSKEPTDGQWGKLIRSSAITGRLPFDEELEYLLRDREEHIKNVIAPALSEGKIVIVDRYYYSTIAYQGSRCNEVASIKTKVLGKQFLVPDLAIVFDLPVDVALSRIKHVRGDIPNEFEKAESLEIIRQIFLELSETQPEIKKIDSTNGINFLHSEIMNLFKIQLMEKNCSKSYPSDCAYCGVKISNNCKYYDLARKIKVLQ